MIAPQVDCLRCAGKCSKEKCPMLQMHSFKSFMHIYARIYSCELCANIWDSLKFKEVVLVREENITEKRNLLIQKTFLGLTSNLRKINAQRF